MRKARTSSSGTSTLTSSATSLTEQDIPRLKCELAASGSSTGTAGSVTNASHTEQPPTTQSGTSPWVLDPGASFHMVIDYLNEVKSK